MSLWAYSIRAYSAQSEGRYSGLFSVYLFVPFARLIDFLSLVLELRYGFFTVHYQFVFALTRSYIS